MLFRIAGIALWNIDVGASDRYGGSKRQGEEDCGNSSFNHVRLQLFRLLCVAGIAFRNVDIRGGDRRYGGQGKGEEQSENGFFHHWFKFLLCLRNECERKARVTALSAEWRAT